MGRRSFFFLLALLLLAPLVAGCSNQVARNQGHAYSMAPLAQMPHTVQQAVSATRHAYQFATLNPGVLQDLPCYCGCAAMGHLSNYSCYVSGSEENGELIYDDHAVNCQICVDITQDAMRMLDEGRDVVEIYDYVNATYSEFGPPTPLK